MSLGGAQLQRVCYNHNRHNTHNPNTNHVNHNCPIHHDKHSTRNRHDSHTRHNDHTTTAAFHQLSPTADKASHAQIPRL